MSARDRQGARLVIKQTPVKGSKKVKVNFVIPKESAAGQVSVVGDFNGWDPFVHPLKPRSNGTKSVSVTLPVSQRFAFKYLDENGQWLDDDAASDYVDNGIGGVNSVVNT
jgi:1,4-alpha-glucan branching enzyme